MAFEVIAVHLGRESVIVSGHVVIHEMVVHNRASIAIAIIESNIQMGFAQRVRVRIGW